MIPQLAAMTLALGVVAYTPTAAAALDLTGTWEGRWTCKDVTSGADAKPGGTLTMMVSQIGGDVQTSVEWFARDGAPYRSETFQGHVQELAAKPGQGASTLVACSSAAYAEALSARVKVSASSATFKGSSAYEAPGATVGGTCKYSLKRTDTADPGVAACPTPSACGNGTLEIGEDCDSGQLGGHTCATRPGFVGGTLRCASGCTFDTSGCYATRFVVNGDGTVTDNFHKLQWEQKTDDGSVHDTDNQYTWCVGGAFPNCANPENRPDGTAFTVFLGTLNNGHSNDGNGGTGNCFAGHCDWRLPTVGELATIRDLSTPMCFGNFPCLDQTIFGPTQLRYWSASTLPGNTRNAWGHFTYLSQTTLPFKSEAIAVRAVRSAP
jgi:hypothetical protein